jgi:hypothetical protein
MALCNYILNKGSKAIPDMALKSQAMKQGNYVQCDLFSVIDAIAVEPYCKVCSGVGI